MMYMNWKTACAAAFLLTAAATPARPQCQGEWLPGEGYPGIGGSPVRAMTHWTPPGGLEALVVAGDFSLAGTTPASNIALWDGASWSALGAGLAGGATPRVAALAVYNGELVAGGHFQTADGAVVNGIARWDGELWHGLGGGPGGTSHPGIYALTVFEGELIAGGWFTQAGGVSASFIARWDGEQWRPLGNGVDGFVHALAIYNGELIVGGSFSHAGGIAARGIARWDGEQWRPLGEGVAYSCPGPFPCFDLPVVAALAVHNGALIAGGFFDSAGGVPAAHIARWDGAEWRSLPGTDMDSSVFALAVHGGELVAGGWFTAPGGPGGVSARHVARWDGAEWQPLGSGTDGEVHALLSQGDELVAGGSFRAAGGVGAPRIASWNGDQWNAFGAGMDGRVDALTVYPPEGGDLVALGLFSRAGDVSASRIARWDGAEWRPLAGGLSGATGPAIGGHSARALTTFRGDLIAGGAFTEADGRSANRIARWDGAAWHALGTGMAGATPGTGHDSRVAALAVYPPGSGDLIAGGDFITAGGAIVNHIARWDGDQWRPLSSGLGGCTGSTPVQALTIFNSELVAGGCFNTAGGVTARMVARWDGARWAPIGAGLDGSVSALAVYDDDLIAAGSFSVGGFISGIMRWDGAEWTPLGGGVRGTGLSLHVHDGELIAGGIFTTSGYVVRWDGEQWRTLGAGMAGIGGIGADPYVRAMTSRSGELIAGGGFLTAGGHFSAFWARWACDCYADCDGSGALDFFDFLCFQNAFAAGDPYADCDGSGQLDFFDFQCFQNHFAAGCP